MVRPPAFISHLGAPYRLLSAPTISTFAEAELPPHLGASLPPFFPESASLFRFSPKPVTEKNFNREGLT